MTDPRDALIERLRSIRNNIEAHRKSFGEEWQDYFTELVSELSAALTLLRPQPSGELAREYRKAASVIRAIASMGHDSTDKEVADEALRIARLWVADDSHDGVEGSIADQPSGEQGKPSALDAAYEKPSYILAMNVLQSDMYRENMDARDAVDAILEEHHRDLERSEALERKHEQSEPVCACPQHGTWVNADDHARLLRDLDVALNGDGAAQAPRLVDIVAQVTAVRRTSGRPLLAPPPSEQAGIAHSNSCSISDEVVERADAVYWAAYPCAKNSREYHLAGMRAVLQWYESAFPRGVGSGDAVAKLRVVENHGEKFVSLADFTEAAFDLPLGDHLVFAHPAPEAQAEGEKSGEVKQWRWAHDTCSWRDGEPSSDALGWAKHANIGIATRVLYLRPQPSPSETPEVWPADWLESAKSEAEDAERYRWMMNNNREGVVCPQIQAMWANCKTAYPSREEWDAAIDAAIQEQRQLRAVAAQRKEGE